MTLLKPEISVIIPVYNVQAYLSQCLDSVLAQTFTDWEALCVNDGSTDDCDKILTEYAQKDKRIKIIMQENAGLSGARNTGLENATGQYIVFLDADDTMPPYALNCLYSIIVRSHVSMVASRYKTPKKTAAISHFTFKVYKDNLLKRFIHDKKIHSHVWNKIYDSALLKNHRFIENIYFEDWPFLMQIFPDITAFAVTDIPCYIYREDNVSITRSKFSQKKVDSYLKGIRITYQLYQHRQDLKIVQKRLTVAAKMMINKVYKTQNLTLQIYAKSEINKLIAEKMIRLYDLPIKTIYRLWRMKTHSSRPV